MRLLCGCAVRSRFSSARTALVTRPVWSRSHLVPVLFVYALSELHIVLAHMCVRTYWDM